MPCRLRSSNEEIFALGDAAAELSITLQNIRQDSTGDEPVPVPLDSVSLQRVTTLFQRQRTRWNIPRLVVKAMLGCQDDPFDHAVTLLRDLHWFNAPLLETALAESVAMLLSGQSARALRLLLRAPKPTWFGDEAMQAALTEPLLTAPQLIGTDGAEEAEEETASSQGMTACTIMMFLERCDARTLRELKAVSAAWQRWAREVLGGANSVWRQLVQQADADEARLEDTDPDVRLEAMHTLGKLDPTLLEQYVDAIITRFDDDHGPVREAALETLGKLDPTLLEQYADAIITRFDDDHGPVREAALETLGNVEPAVLSEHAAAIAEMFDDDYEPEIDDLGDVDGDVLWFQPRAPVRSTAVRVLGRLTQGALATHMATVIAMLDDYWDVRTAALYTLGKLEPALLAQHEEEVAEKLCDVHEHVRQAALETLSKLGPAVVAQRMVEILEGHDGTIGIFVSTLDADDGDDVLETACQVLGSLDPTEIAPYAPEIIRFVSKFDERVRDESVLKAALETLAKLDPAVLAECAIDMIDCEYDGFGVAAIQLLGTLDPTVLEQHAAAIVARLDGLQYSPGNYHWGDWRQIRSMGPGYTVLLREQGESKLLSDRLLEILGKLEPAVLAQHATTVISMLDVDNDDVSDAACEFLDMLDPTVLEQHAAAIAARLGDDWRAQLTYRNNGV